MNKKTPRNCFDCKGDLEARTVLEKFSNKQYGHQYCPKCHITFDSNVNDVIEKNLSAELVQSIDDEEVYRNLFVETSRISDDEGNIYPDFEWDNNDTVKLGVAEHVINSIDDCHTGGLHKLADVGCGDGFTSVKLSENYPNAIIYAIDPSPLVLRLRKHEGIIPKRGTIQTSNLPDNSIDVIAIIGNWMLHVDPFDTVKHAYRNLRENGTLVLDFKNVRSISRITAKYALRFGLDRLGGRGYLERNFVNMRYGMHKEFVKRQLEALGFEVLVMFDKPPRLLEFKNRSAYQKGVAGVLWRVLNEIDKVRGEQAWVQLVARKIQLPSRRR